MMHWDSNIRKAGTSVVSHHRLSALARAKAALVEIKAGGEKTLA
jgi:hypothetical protein